MKAKIKQMFVRKLRGKTYTVKTFIARKDNIIDKVNNYIQERINKENYIQIKRFEVNIYSQRGILETGWIYKPTYRD